MTRVFVYGCLIIAVFATLLPCAALAGSATINWQANTEPDLDGYRVYYGTSPGMYGPYIPVGKVTSYTMIGLTDGVTYYFVVTAVDQAGNESAYSSPVVSKTIPESVPQPSGKKDRPPGKSKK